MDYPGKVITKTQVTPTQTSASGNWTLDDQAAAIKNNNWPVALVPNPISKSLRFNSADSAYLNRTFVGTPNTYTLSMWVKRGSSFGSQMFIVGSRAGSSTDGTIQFNTSNQITVVLANTYVITTTAVYRDPAAWYHLVLSVTASGTAYLYINNVQVGSVAVGATCWLFNSTNTNTIGRYGSSASLYYDGYLTEINFIDGQALTPSSFGMTNPQTGQWIPIKYSGTYGTNGFYLNFKDATSTTTLGYDYSGNANNWTTNNFSVTAGVGNDSLTDVPTPWVAYSTTGDSGGVVRGNYATMNPVAATGGVTLTNGNLRASVAQKATPRYISVSTIAFTGIIYAEITITPGGGPNPSPSIGIKNSNYKSFEGSGTTVGQFAYGFRDSSTPNILKDENGSSSTLVAGGSISAGNVMMLAVDVAAGKMWLGQNGSWLASGNPTTGANPAISGFDTTVPYWFYCATDQGTTTDNVFEWNFGQRPFAYTPPAGFRSLCTTNLPATTIGFGLTNQGDDYFNTLAYSGTGSNQTLTVGFQPDFAWFKKRSAAESHILQNSIAGNTKFLISNSTAAEDTSSALIQSFNSDGVTIGVSSTINGSSTTYVGWFWKASGSTVSNTAGTITSTVSANTTAGFSIVTWTGTGSTGTVGHGLSSAPFFIIAKRRNASTNWQVYHKSLTASNQVCLNLANASFSTTTWNSTEPTSSVFSIDNVELGANGATMVAYCFAAVAGYSAFGSYTGNGSTDGPFTYTGFRPAFILVKRTDVANYWMILDDVRRTFNPAFNGLYPNNSDAETNFGNSTGIDFLSNGFKQRDNVVSTNASGGTYIYAAFAEFPFQFANAR